MTSHIGDGTHVNRTVGDVVAVVVADNDTIAQDAVELIDARHDSLPAVTDVYDATPSAYRSFMRSIRTTSPSTGWKAIMTRPMPPLRGGGRAWSCSISMWSTIV